MGSVWLAQHLSLNVPVAVKFIDAAFRDKDDHRSRFAIEARTAAKISSPHVVNILDFGTDDEGRLYIAMEYLQGEDLEHLLARRGRLSPATTARVLSHACHGLSKAHALGVVHRDIKPENLFVCGDQDGDEFVVKILDFGVAKAGQDIREQFHGTRAGQLIGSPAYMSPEQARGAKATDYRSDLFSLGVVAYHCLTGCPPFPGEGLGELLLAIIDSTPIPVTKLVPTLPASLDTWFNKVLAKNPNERFQSAREMADAFASASGKSITVSSNQDAFSSGLNAVPSNVVEGQASRSSSFSTSNTTCLREVLSALAQVADVPGVLGVALLDGAGECIAHYSTFGMQPTSFAEALAAVRDALDSFDALDATEPRAMGLHFDTAVVQLRWLESCPLIVIGIETVHPTVLSVSLSGAASKLSVLARQHGGTAQAFRKTHASARPPDSESGIVATASFDDVVPPEVLQQLTTLMAAELGPLARVGIQRQLKRDGAPTFRTYAAFVERLAMLASHDEPLRARLQLAAMRLVPRLPPAHAPGPSAPANDGAHSAKVVAPVVEESGAGAALERSKGTVVWAPVRQPTRDDNASEPSIEIGAPVELREELGVEPLPELPKPAPEPPKSVANAVAKAPPKKPRTYVYRGKVYTIDE